MSKKVQEFKIEISHSVESYEDYDGDGYCTAYNGEVDHNELEDYIRETFKQSLELTIDENSEEEVGFKKEDIDDLVDNIEIDIDADISNEPIEIDVFSPFSGHGTVTGGVDSTENITVVLKIKDVNINKLTKDDFEIFMEDFKEDHMSLFNSPEYHTNIKMVEQNKPKPKKRKFGR